MKKIMNYLKLIRIKQWVKNIIVLLPYIFGKMIKVETLQNGICAFFSFCCLASSVYILNDIKDIESDKKHPIKCMRVIASGAISMRNAVLVQVILFFGGIFLIGVSNSSNILGAFTIYVMYFVVNIFYSLKGKNIPLVDIFILVLGFLLRLFYGSVIEGVEVSVWLYLVIISGAFYLGLGKRRNELKLLELDSNREGRPVLKYYSYKFLDKNLYSFQTLVIIFYSLWCANYPQIGKSRLLLCTIPIVILIALKYSMSIEQDDAEGDPTDTIMGDKVLLGLILIYGIVLIGIVYI